MTYLATVAVGAVIAAAGLLAVLAAAYFSLTP